MVNAGARWRMTGLAIGAGIGFALTRTYLFDFAPVALALSTSMGVLIGGAVTPRPARRRGAASLRPRRVREYIPRSGLAVSALLGFALVAFTTLSPTPMRPDHEIQYFGVAEPVTLDTTFATLSVVALVTGLAIWAIVRSPQTGIDDHDRAEDDAWRRATVHAIANSCAALFALVFTAVAFWYADQQLDWRAQGSPPRGFALAVLAGVGLVLFARYAGAMAPEARNDLAQPPPATGGEVDAGRAEE